MANSKIKIIKATMNTINELYNDSALTIEGLSSDSIPDFVNHIDKLTKLHTKRAYVTSGKQMNTFCSCTGSNRYPDDLNIVSIKLSDMANYENVIISRFSFGGRWFDDIVDNNKRRELEKKQK